MSGDFKITEKAPSRSATLLREIASALGESQAVFLHGADEGSKRAQACELMRIWDSLEDEAARQKLLTLARGLVQTDL